MMKSSKASTTPQTAPQTAPAAPVVDREVVAELVARAQADGMAIGGEGGLMAQLTKIVLESSLHGEMDAHLGYGKHDPVGRDGGNSRNGTRSKTVLTEAGPVEITVPRDREGSFEPKIVRKRQRRLGGIDGIVLSLTAKGLTTGEISAHWPRSTAPRCRRTPSPRSPTGCSRAWPSGRTGHSIGCIR
jgi:putative transposase